MDPGLSGLRNRAVFFYETASTRISFSCMTFLNREASPSTLPMMLTALAGTMFPPELRGVGPKKMQKALPVRLVLT